jgi:hypothetical protein
MNINHERKKRVEINNLKMARNLGMILKEEFKKKVKASLELLLVFLIKNIGLCVSISF